MTQLTIPPKRMSYDDVTTIFERLTDGNLECGFVPGYHFKILNELSEEVGHLNFRVGQLEFQCTFLRSEFSDLGNVLAFALAEQP